MAGHSTAGEHRTDRDRVVRRIAERRAELGLSESALSTRAAMSPRYLQHLLDTGPDFDPGGLLRVAAALGLTYQELLEGRREPPPGESGPGPRPMLAHLTVAQCWERLGSHGVGRIAMPVQPGPAVFPVNYTVDAGTVVYRTASGGAAAPEAGEGVSFQVDRMDDRLSRGWSVLITGTAEKVEDPATVQRLDTDAAEPWTQIERPVWIRIRPKTVTGRRIDTE
jgi:transcriptional regulator with XRE-family HTH domain